MPNARAQNYENLISTSPNLQAFLNLIGFAEGTGARYNVGYGYRTFNDYSWHPYAPRAFITNNGTTTSAAGRYQFERGTWDSVARALGLKDFSADSQDIAATALIDDRHALQDVLQGNVQSAINKLKPEWEGFKKKDLNTLLAQYTGIKKKILDKTPEAPPPCQTSTQTRK